MNVLFFLFELLIVKKLRIKVGGLLLNKRN